MSTTQTASAPYRIITLGTAKGRDLQPIRTPQDENQCLVWHVSVASEYSPVIRVEVPATSQKRAEQYAKAWVANRYLRNPGTPMTCCKTELVD
jgi:hypothetical protein